MKQESLSRHTNTTSSRRWAIVLCSLAAAVGLVYAANRGQLAGWWQSSAGGIPYVLFFIFLLAILFPGRKFLLPTCIGVTLVTCGLEFLQLWNPPMLSAIRQTRLGAVLVGRQFQWSDFAGYFVGCMIGVLLLNLLAKKSAS